MRVLRHPAFLAGDTDTAFFDRHGLDTLAAPLADASAVRLSALAACIADAAANRAAARVQGGLPSGWRNVVSAPHRREFEGDLTVSYRFTRTGALVADDHDDVRLLAGSPHEVVLEKAGQRRAFAVADYGSSAQCTSTPCWARSRCARSRASPTPRPRRPRDR